MMLSEMQIDAITDAIMEKRLSKEEIKKTVVEYIEEHAEEFEENQYGKPEVGESYNVVRISTGGAYVSEECWEDMDDDNDYYDSGDYFEEGDEVEAEHFVAMLDYAFLAQKKAREMGGFLGYGNQVPDKINAYNLVWFEDKLKVNAAVYQYERTPMNPLFTRECAERLVKDPEVIESAKKAWGVE